MGKESSGGLTVDGVDPRGFRRDTYLGWDSWGTVEVGERVTVTGVLPLRLTVRVYSDYLGFTLQST